jgi:hypothetical protein
MPRFYFHIRSDDGVELDREGVEFDSLDAAIEDAKVAGREIIGDEASDGNLKTAKSVFQIADESGQVVAVVPFLKRDS